MSDKTNANRVVICLHCHLRVVSTVYSQGTNANILLFTLYMLPKVYIIFNDW